MKYRQTQSGETILARVSCVVDAPLLKLMEEDYQLAGTEEKADWWQPRIGCIRYKNFNEITLGSCIMISALRIIRSYSEQECRMIIIEPIPREWIAGLKERSPKELAVKIARFMGACSSVIGTIKGRWPEENEDAVL